MDAPGWRLVQVREYTVLITVKNKFRSEKRLGQVRKHSENKLGQKVQSEKAQVRKYSQKKSRYIQSEK